MFNKILVAVDVSHDTGQERALAAARKLGDVPYSEILALTVVEPMPGLIAREISHEERVEAGDAAMKALRTQAGQRSEVQTFVRHGRPAHEIIEFAKEHDVDCIIVASHRPGLSDYLLGSTAGRVVRHSPCTVIVLR